MTTMEILARAKAACADAADLKAGKILNPPKSK